MTATAYPSRAASRCHASAARQQKGVATLMISLALFLMSMLILLYVNRGAVTEQRISANEQRAKVAMANALAGLDHALAYMRDGGIDKVAPAGPEVINGGQRYRAWYCDPAAAVPACPANAGAAFAGCTPPALLSDVVGLSCGWSDDNSAVQRVVQRLSSSGDGVARAAVPLISKGTANLLVGGASVLNFYNDLTVWSGGPLLSQSNAGKTFTRNPFAAPGTLSESMARIPPNSSPACNNPPQGYTCNTQGPTLGHDIVVGDTSLASLSNDAFFAKFFDVSPQVYRETQVNKTVAPADVGTLAGAQALTIWITGDVTLPANAVIGTLENPVTIIVDGVLTLGSNTVVNGLVYARGGVEGNGGTTIYGALINAGPSATGGGNLTIVYDPNVLGRATRVSLANKVTSTFRDW